MALALTLDLPIRTLLVITGSACLYCLVETPGSRISSIRLPSLPSSCIARKAVLGTSPFVPFSCACQLTALPLFCGCVDRLALPPTAASPLRYSRQSASICSTTATSTTQSAPSSAVDSAFLVRKCTSTSMFYLRIAWYGLSMAVFSFQSGIATPF